MTAQVRELYAHCLARDWEFTTAARDLLARGGLDTGAGKLLVERAPFRLTLLHLLDTYPALAEVGRPDWVDEFTHTEDGLQPC